ncbi:putative receptor-like protein kinase At3g47110 [Salvia splendens]|uniref:putative receptor-like protein kinase At3g47110 n=1 Tax=Salvia splendens TaxID=180675 RepID=UPI001C25DC95|nr:putative receptor-like protein kinase At3g47110 [Salvia splendens]
MDGESERIDKVRIRVRIKNRTGVGVWGVDDEEVGDEEEGSTSLEDDDIDEDEDNYLVEDDYVGDGKNALVSFKNSITSDPYAILSTNCSQNTSVCSWIGASCGLKHQRVTALNLSGYDLAGTVAPHLGNLTFLRYLDISSNSFTGILPFELSELHRLRVNMGMNSFTGEIPTWLGSLPQLEKLYLYNNIFLGIIPEEIGNLPQLEMLSIPSSSLTENIPSSVFNISSLKFMDLSNKSLSGNIPTFHNVPKLEELYLLRNNLQGIIPDEIGNLS